MALGSPFINPSTHDQKCTLHLSRGCLRQLSLTYSSLHLPRPVRHLIIRGTARGKLIPQHHLGKISSCTYIWGPQSESQLAGLEGSTGLCVFQKAPRTVVMYNQIQETLHQRHSTPHPWSRNLSISATRDTAFNFSPRASSKSLNALLFSKPSQEFLSVPWEATNFTQQLIFFPWKAAYIYIARTKG